MSPSCNLKIVTHTMGEDLNLVGFRIGNQQKSLRIGWIEVVDVPIAR